jgi:Uma2 family endonuclease
VIEVRSPNDESYEKLPFFAKLGVGAVIIVDRDTKRVELFRLSGGRYEPAATSADGSLSPSPRLRVADAADPSIQAEI